MFFVRTLICATLTLLAGAILNTMLGTHMGPGGAVVFMLFTLAVIILTFRLPLPPLSEGSHEEIKARRQHRS